MWDWGKMKLWGEWNPGIPDTVYFVNIFMVSNLQRGSDEIPSKVDLINRVSTVTCNCHKLRQFGFIFLHLENHLRRRISADYGQSSPEVTTTTHLTPTVLMWHFTKFLIFNHHTIPEPDDDKTAILTLFNYIRHTLKWPYKMSDMISLRTGELIALCATFVSVFGAIIKIFDI